MLRPTLKSAFIVVGLVLCATNGINSERIALKTTDTAKIYNFFPLHADYIEFEVRAKNDIHILLSETYDYFGKWYELVIGGWANSRSVIRRDHDDNIVADVPGSYINDKVFDTYWILIERNLGFVSLGKKPSKKPILHYKDGEFVNVTYIGFSTGFGSKGEWFMDNKYFSKPCSNVECVCSTKLLY